MQLPLQVSCRKVGKTAAIEDLIRAQTAKLERVCDHIVGCKIAIEQPQKHQRSGNPFRVRISVTVPPEHELVVTRESSEGDLTSNYRQSYAMASARCAASCANLVEKQHGDVKIIRHNRWEG